MPPAARPLRPALLLASVVLASPWAGCAVGPPDAARSKTPARTAVRSEAESRPRAPAQPRARAPIPTIRMRGQAQARSAATDTDRAAEREIARLLVEARQEVYAPELPDPVDRGRVARREPPRAPRRELWWELPTWNRVLRPAIASFPRTAHRFRGRADSAFHFVAREESLIAAVYEWLAARMEEPDTNPHLQAFLAAMLDAPAPAVYPAYLDPVERIRAAYARYCLCVGRTGLRLYGGTGPASGGFVREPLY